MGANKHQWRWGVLALQGVGFAVAVFLIVLKTQVSPGELAAVHGREPSLDGNDGCAQCHGERRELKLANPCARCHAEIGRESALKSGFHGSLEPELLANCGTCRQEHKGKDFPPVNRQSFLLAGIQDAAKYAHEGLDFHLDGKHEGLDCKRCHLHAEAKVLAKGEKRYLGLDQACTRCHKDVHEGVFGAQCQTCHGQEQPFKAIAGFHHTEAFPLSGRHAGLSCIRCHESGSPQSISALIGSTGRSSVPVRGCAACHRSPHPEEFLVRVGKPLGLAAPQTCVRCHSAEHQEFSGPVATLTKAQHASTGFPLVPPHDTVACKACHADYGKSLPEKDPLDAYHRRYPGRSPDNCRACHGDPHRGEFEIGAFKGKDCLACHSRTAFSPAEFDMTRHDVAFHLEGRHRKLQCSQCHASKTADGPPDFRGVPVDCRSCHKDPHGGQFNRPLYLGNDCRVCHSQSSWRPPTFTVAMHQKSGFDLTGAHLGLACTRCHTVPEQGRSSTPVSTPALRAFAGLPTDCSACHADVHAGKFDGPGRPAVIDGKSGCARCHGTDRFSAPTVKGFDHAQWTNYPLKGAHAKLDCAACHGRSGLPDPKGRTLGIAAGVSCQSCHADPHVGQFGSSAAVNCAKCHREEGSFHNITFDHQKDSRFGLDELHSKLECAKCHKPMPAARDVLAIRYKPLGVKCGDCHDPRGAKEGSKP